MSLKESLEASVAIARADKIPAQPWTYEPGTGVIRGSDGRAILYVSATRMDNDDAMGKPGPAHNIGTLAAAAPALVDALRRIAAWRGYRTPEEGELSEYEHGANDGFEVLQAIANEVLARLP